MADETPGTEPETTDVAEVEADPVDGLSIEDVVKLQRGEIEPPEKKGKKDKSETVSFDRFEYTDKQRKQAEERAERAERSSTLAMQRMAELLEASKQPPPEPEPEIDLGPDPEVDPIASVKWFREQKALEIEQRKAWDKQQREQHSQQSEAYQKLERVNSRLASAKAQNPAFEEAHNAWRESVARELSVSGYRDQALVGKMNELEVQWALWAYDNQRPIEEVLMGLAASRGYQAKAGDEEQSERKTPPHGPDGKFLAAADKMDKREATKTAAKSLSGGGAAADMGELTPQMVVDMSEEEFKAFKSKYGENAMAKAFGVRH